MSNASINVSEYDAIVEVTSLYSPEALLEIEAIAVADEAVERT